MAGLLGMAAPTAGVGLLDMAADVPRAQAKEVKKATKVPQSYDELVEIKNRYGTFSAEYMDALDEFMRAQDGYGFTDNPNAKKPGESFKDWAKRTKGAREK